MGGEWCTASAPDAAKELVLVHLNHHLVLERAFQFAILLEVVLPQTAEVLFLFHDCVVALLPEDLVFLTLLVNFSCVALFKRHHLFLVEALPVPGSKAQLRFLQRAVSQGPRQLRQCRPA